MGVQVEGSGPGGRGVEGRRGPSHLEGDPLDPSGLRVVGAQKDRSRDEGDHGDGPEVVSSQEVGAQDSRASATKVSGQISTILVSSSSSVLRGRSGLCDGGQLSCVCVFLHLSRRLARAAAAAGVWELYRGQKLAAPGSQIRSAAGKADKRLPRPQEKRQKKWTWWVGEKTRAGTTQKPRLYRRKYV